MSMPPVSAIAFSIVHYALVLAALLIVGILHKLISSSDTVMLMKKSVERI